MKKIVSLILCVSMLFALSACAELDALRNAELPPLPTAEPKATEEPVSADEETARETEKRVLAALAFSPSPAPRARLLYALVTPEGVSYLE